MVSGTIPLQIQAEARKERNPSGLPLRNTCRTCSCRVALCSGEQIKSKLKQLTNKADKEAIAALKEAIILYLRRKDYQAVERFLSDYQKLTIKLAKELFGVRFKEIELINPFSTRIPNIVGKYRKGQIFKLEDIEPSKVDKIISELVSNVTTEIAEQLVLKLIYLIQLQALTLEIINQVVTDILQSDLPNSRKASDLEEILQLLKKYAEQIKGGVFKQVLDHITMQLERVLNMVRNNNLDSAKALWKNEFQANLPRLLSDTKKIKRITNLLELKIVAQEMAKLYKAVYRIYSKKVKARNVVSLLKPAKLDLQAVMREHSLKLAKLKACALKGKTDEQFKKLHKLYTKIYRIVIVYYKHRWKIIGAAFAALMIALILLGKFVLKKSLKDLINPKGFLRAVKELITHPRIIVRLITSLILLALIGLITLAGYELYQQFFNKTIREGEIIYAIEKLAEENKI